MKQLFRGRNALILGVAVASIGIAVGLIVASQVGSGGGGSTSPPVDAAGAAETTQLLTGIPQQGNVLGKAGAPVTMIEFADVQCPFCARFAIDLLPTIVGEYVRTGKVKLVFNGMHFIGDDSVKALRAAYAAALQQRLWNVVGLLYKNQGQENSGWVSESLLGSIGNSVPGLDGAKMLAARNSAEVAQAISLADGQAEQAHVNSTPTFFIGKTGETLQQLQLPALDIAPFRQAFDTLLK
jgi:protein-disulfide isomerase